MAAVCIQAPRPSQMGLRPWSRAASTRQKHRLSEKQLPCLSGDWGLCPISPPDGWVERGVEAAAHGRQEWQQKLRAAHVKDAGS